MFVIVKFVHANALKRQRLLEAFSQTVGGADVDTPQFNNTLLRLCMCLVVIVDLPDGKQPCSARG